MIYFLFPQEKSGHMSGKKVRLCLPEWFAVGTIQDGRGQGGGRLQRKLRGFNEQNRDA